MKPLSGCSIFPVGLLSGTISDSVGSFTLKLTPGKHTLSFNHLGYERKRTEVFLSKDSSRQYIMVIIKPESVIEQEILVTGERNRDALSQKLQSKDVTRIPTIFNDVLRGITILSGVSSNNELSSGYNVRGGNYNENLIYLNGYEIFRPFLLREGTEENQTLMNPEMVEKIDFFNGSFSVEYGDKMSSAVSVQYQKKQSDTLHIKTRANFLNAGVSAGKRFGNLNVLVGTRYAYPGMFLSQMQTEGRYRPFYADFQMLASYLFPGGDELELFTVYAKNTYDLTPADWTGHIQSDRGSGLANAIQIKYNGKREYSFLTSLAALRFTKRLAGESAVTVSLSQNTHNEDETSNLWGEYFYIPDAYHMDEGREYLKTRVESTDDHLRIRQQEASAVFNTVFDTHKFQTGIFGRWRTVHDVINEAVSETGDVVVLDTPDTISTDSRFSPNEFGFYTMDTWQPNNRFELKGGVRVVYENESDELLISPRLQSNFHLDDKNMLFAAWGLYYQPPYYLERRNNNVPLSSQRTIHYSAGWENSFKETMFLRIELYYKKLHNLIPYYLEDQKIIYTGTNRNEGYAYGMDVMVRGEVIKGIQSWLGYGYLNTRERPETGGPYTRRLTDQTHSILVFLQDRIKKHQNWQVHTRLLMGSGMLYYDRTVVIDPVTGKRSLAVSYQSPLEYLLYFRVDMGCSTAFTLANDKKLTVTAEVLNMFAQNNYSGYRFIQVFKDIPYPVRVPQVLSPRFFNLQVEYEL